MKGKMVMMAHLIGEMEKHNVREPTKHKLLHLVWHLQADAISHIKHFNKTPKVRYMEPKNQGSNDQFSITEMVEKTARRMGSGNCLMQVRKQQAPCLEASGVQIFEKILRNPQDLGPNKYI